MQFKQFVYQYLAELLELQLPQLNPRNTEPPSPIYPVPTTTSGDCVLFQSSSLRPLKMFS